jgi:hypothetical protein
VAGSPKPVRLCQWAEVLLDGAMSPKQDFLVVYDYGMGGVWAIIKARSADEITKKYPMFIVRTERPAWMDDDQYKRTADKFTFDIDDPPTGWLLTVVTKG